MKIISTYPNNALERQCGEAVWIKEIDPAVRINNKQEYHQPGDVEVSYAKNDIINDKKKKNQISLKPRIETIREESPNIENEDFEQRKITEFFIKNVRKECENLEKENIVEENEPMLSTQENIEDARERRILRLRGRKELFQCDNCQFESGSKTLLTKHVNTTHKEMIVETQDMRKRFACDVCGFKTI